MSNILSYAGRQTLSTFPFFAFLILQEESSFDNEPLYWFIPIAIGIVLIGFLIRYAVYTYVVSEKRSLPDKATRLANIITILFITIGLISAAIKLYLVFAK